jgi:hypothetical protein
VSDTIMLGVWASVLDDLGVETIHHAMADLQFCCEFAGKTDVGFALAAWRTQREAVAA